MNNCTKRIQLLAIILIAALAMLWTVIPAKAATAEGFSFGSKNVILSEGTYTVPLRLKNASNPEKDSVAAGCPGKYGKLTISESGEASLTMECRKVSMSSFSDYAYNFMIYQNEKRSSSELKTAATVLETYPDVPKTINGQSSYAPKKISFTIPEVFKKADGVYLNMHVDAMNAGVDAYLFIDYANAKPVNDSTYNYIKKGSAQVKQFGKYTVNADVTVTEGVISSVSLTGTDFQEGQFGTENQKYLKKAIKGMESKLTGLYANDDDLINNVDVVSGATASSTAIKNAVMNALDIKIKEDTIATAPQNAPAAGMYKIKIKNITDVVDHSIIGAAGTDKWRDAYLGVDAAGVMTLYYTHISGTVEEPLYVLGFNGYYTTVKDGALKKDAVYKTTAIDDKTVVTDVQLPLGKKPQEQYFTNVHLYVDSMKNLNDTVAGIIIKNGEFDTDSTITLDWNTLKPVLEDGTYSIDGVMKKASGSDVSMANNAITHKLKLTVENGNYTITMNLKGMNISLAGQSFKGYLQNIKYYRTGYAENAYGVPVGETADVTVESVQKYTDGTKVKDEFGTDYPDIVTIPVIPEALISGNVPLQVFIPVMNSIMPGNGTQNVSLSLDWDSAKKASADDPAFSAEDVVETNPGASDNTNKDNNKKDDNKDKNTDNGNKKPADTTKKPQIKPAVKKLKKGSKYTVGGNVYQALSANTISFVKATNKGSVTVPATITTAGVKATVTAIGNNAFASAKKKVTSVTVGSNVTTIGKKSFAGCSKLKKINIQSQKLKKVGAKALQGIYKKAVIKVPKKNKKAYTKLFKGKGQKKTVKVK